MFAEKRLMKLRDFFILFGVIIGLILSVNGLQIQSIVNANIMGICLVFIASLFYAVSLMLSQHVVRQIGSINLTSLSEIAAFLVLLIYIAIKNNGHFTTLFKIPASSYLFIFIMVFSTVIPFFILNECIKQIGASKVSLISIIGPIFTSFIDILLLKEHLTFSQILGGLCILFSIYLIDFYQRREIKNNIPSIDSTELRKL